MSSKLKEYLADPFLNQMYSEIRTAGPLRSILVDITHACNIRCEGCFFFAENMDQHKAPEDEAEFDAFLESELQRGTNYITVAGGEPTLMLGRVKKIYDRFKLITVTNGIRPIPMEGFEKMPIGVSVWGDHETDTWLRGKGKLDIFAKALKNYKDDPRAIWYYTTTPGKADEVASVVEQIVQNGNYVVFNFYGDLSHLGGDVDHRRGFGRVNDEISRMIERYPQQILTSTYIGEVITTGTLYGEKWGYETCCSISPDNPVNADRIQNGNVYNEHFRAYNPDLKSTRRCCVGENRDCSTCFDVWSHIAWITLSMKKHLGSQQEFTNWLTSMYLFYLTNRIVDFDSGIKLLPEIHQRVHPLHDKGAMLA